MRHFLLPAALLLSAFSIPTRMAAQSSPTGTDINQAIPIYFGQVISDIGDRDSAPSKVYSITLAKGQTISAVLSASGKTLTLALYVPGTSTIGSCTWSCASGSTVSDVEDTSNASIKYTVSTAGTYYLRASFANASTNWLPSEKCN